MKKCTYDNRLTQIFRYSPQSPPFSYYTFAFNVSNKIWPRQLNQYLAVCYCISKYVCLCGVLIASQCAAITSWLVADRGPPDQMVPPLCESLVSMRPLLKSQHIKGFGHVRDQPDKWPDHSIEPGSPRPWWAWESYFTALLPQFMPASSCLPIMKWCYK